MVSVDSKGRLRASRTPSRPHSKAARPALCIRQQGFGLPSPIHKRSSWDCGGSQKKRENEVKAGRVPLNYEFRNYASAWRDRWNSVMELFMAGGNYAASGVPFPKGFPEAVQLEIQAARK